MGKDTGYYPEGPMNQHKAMAADDPKRMAQCNTEDKETVPSPWGEGTSHPGKVHKSGTSTGKA